MKCEIRMTTFLKLLPKVNNGEQSKVDCCKIDLSNVDKLMKSQHLLW